MLPNKKVGTFIAINGSRYNLEKIRTYAIGDETILRLVWDSGLSTNISFNSKADADAMLALLDEYCL